MMFGLLASRRIEGRRGFGAAPALFATGKFIVEPVFGKIQQAHAGNRKSTRRAGNDLNDTRYSEVYQDVLRIARYMGWARRSAGDDPHRAIMGVPKTSNPKSRTRY